MDAAERERAEIRDDLESLSADVGKVNNTLARLETRAQLVDDKLDDIKSVFIKGLFAVLIPLILLVFGAVWTVFTRPPL